MPYSHNSNGQVENANRRVMDVLRAMILDDRLGPQTHLQWSLLLPENEESIFSEEIWMPTAQEPDEASDDARSRRGSSGTTGTRLYYAST